MGDRHIFSDLGGTRWRRLRNTTVAAGVVATIVAGVFLTSVLIHPLLPATTLRARGVLSAVETVLPAKPPTTRRESHARKAEHRLLAANAQAHQVASEERRQTRAAAAPPLPALLKSDRPLAFAFYVNWDDSSWASLKQNIDQLDALSPEWLRLAPDGNDLLRTDFDPRVLKLVGERRPEMPILPLLQNYHDERWDTELLAARIGSAQARSRLVDAIVAMIDQNHFAGLCVDFEELGARPQRDLQLFMKQLLAAFRPHGWLLAQALPFDNPDWDYPAYAATTDLLVLMAYDQHWAAGSPGPISSQDWFERTLAKRLRELDPGRTIIAIGSYGYDWRRGAREATELTFQEAVLSARDSEAKIRFDPASRNPTFAYQEEGARHAVWFLDAVTAWNQMRAATARGVAGFALWRLGAEDPSLWMAFGRAHPPGAPQSMSTIRYGYDVDFEGVGEILQVIAEPRDGQRQIEIDPQNGQIQEEKYLGLPSSFVIRRAGDRQGQIALTFDDGPDPRWTPEILDTLRREGVPATFFIIGAAGQAHPELLRRIIDEGHEIGNHTFTHPNLGEIPSRLIELELDATQRLIEAVTGHSTLLFRPPYFGDAEPQTPDEVEPAVRAQRLGYLTVGLRIDPLDWKLDERSGQPRSADDIVQDTLRMAQATDEDERGEVVLLHDGGGDRSRTVEALPRLIEELRGRGVKFVPISALADLTRDQVMPRLPDDQSWLARVDAIVFYTASLAGFGLRWLFIFGVALGLARVAIIGSLALLQWVRSRQRARNALSSLAETPSVSVVVPAFNEERVIVRTIESLLLSDYPDFEILVVDDGSTDRTSEIVREAFGAEPRVRLFRKINQGKAAAINAGLTCARGEIVITLDADTILTRATISRLVRRLDDPRVGAVAGNAKVGNRINLVSRWQALEYVTSQNLDRRALALLNGITVVPGAVGAWRRRAVDDNGGFSSDTLAEDQDLTIQLRRRGHRIEYADDAIAWTEAPDTLRGLAKQRFRWSYGTLQCLWKHRGALLRLRYGALGLIAMPSVWLFQVLFSLLSPIIDLTLAWSLIGALLERLQHPQETMETGLSAVLFWYALFLIVDWLGAALAFALEKGEDWNLLWWLGLQRFGYRQMMYGVMVRSVLSALRGALVGWGKLERKATVAEAHLLLTGSPEAGARR